MAKEWAKEFYASKAWIKTREAYLISVFHLCERCGDPAKIVHHKEYLTPENINDPEVSLNWGKLEALCQDCHNKEHHADDYDMCADGLYFDEDGMLRKKIII